MPGIDEANLKALKVQLLDLAEAASLLCEKAMPMKLPGLEELLFELKQEADAAMFMIATMRSKASE